MKSIEQQKSELLDKFCNELKTTDIYEIPYLASVIAKMLIKHEEITAQKPLSQNPYCDEVFGGRLMGLLNDYWGTNHPYKHISTLPHVSFFDGVRGFGRKTREEYVTVLEQYGFTDKI